MKKIQDNYTKSEQQPKWLHRCICPYCGEKTFEYIDFSSYKRKISAKEENKYIEWLSTYNWIQPENTKCKHLAFITDDFTTDPFVSENRREVLLNLPEKCYEDEYKPLFYPENLGRYLDDFLSEHYDEAQEIISEILPDYLNEVEYIETSFQKGPPLDGGDQFIYWFI